MGNSARGRTFATNDSVVVDGPRGQRVHRDTLEHMSAFEPRLHTVSDRAWCVVGNGLSNQTFIDAPEGLIAIDTGECVEEMRVAIDMVRTVSDRPLAAVIYTHFHYVNGTAAIFDDARRRLPVWAHARVATNRSRTMSAISPAYNRGLVEQFGVSLPLDGPDGIVGVGLGFYLRNPAHAPHTPGYVEADHTFDSSCRITVAGLDLDITPAPSDADDSVTIHAPSLDLVVNNLVWPTLFNVFAIRGEEYRDPMVLIGGLDHLLSLRPERLIGAHGIPITGREEIARRVTRYRDSIQFLWDQTVRHTNRGANSIDLAHLVRLPDWADDDYLTTEHYGVTEHHVRQIRSGLFGFFDGNESNLFTHPTHERNDRFITAMGGRETVRTSCRTAFADGDLRWSLELSSMLAHSSHCEATDRGLLAETLRAIAQRTTAANIRNWCLTRARHWDASADMGRLNTHRFSSAAIVSGSASDSVHQLRVLVDPQALDDLDAHVAVDLGERGRAGLHVRNNVCVPTSGTGADHVVSMTAETWAQLLTGRTTMADATAHGLVTIDGDERLVRRIFNAFDVASLHS